jgi:8-oxo-dGTP pyrophosphatase MutT (NUDIX family)
VDPRLLAVARASLPAAATVAAPSPTVAAALADAGFQAHARGLERLRPGDVDAIALLDDELGRAGDHTEALLAEAGAALAPGGLLLVSARNPLTADPAGERRAIDAAELRRILGHRGLALELLAAPGAAQRLAGGDRPCYDPHLDRRPGLLDASDLVVAVARQPADQAARSSEFFATLPRKVVAAAVVCRDSRDRLLVVYDSFKQHWTIPGGVVDPDEDPQSGAVREAREEAGIEVSAGDLLGVFAGRWPDRLVFVYAAVPVADPPPDPRPAHPHEIGAAEWVDLGEALERLAPHVRNQVTRCLRSPGTTWPPADRA